MFTISTKPSPIDTVKTSPVESLVTRYKTMKFSDIGRRDKVRQKEERELF